MDNTAIRKFPNWDIQMSIAEYVTEFEALNGLKTTDVSHLPTTPSPTPEGPELIAEYYDSQE